MSQHAVEVAEGKRFSFGKNWRRFLAGLNEEHIVTAETSLREMLEVDELNNKSFLDIGSGSGLFSLAARRMGARVHSFDYDPQSVACTLELKHRYFPDDAHWSVEESSVLDTDYVVSLGEFDVVYSWGVLHHTGALWQALSNATIPVRPGGKLFIAIYNDQGSTSRRWAAVKHFYCSGSVNKIVVIGTYIPFTVFRGVIGDLLHRRNPAKLYTEYGKSRGMSRVTDWADWLGGYPFEVAKPDAVFNFCRDRGFSLTKLVTCAGSHGNNQFVFERTS